ncbi:MAG: nucleotidyltransferase domain-containing protein, partial [Mycobacterium sp.]
MVPEKLISEFIGRLREAAGTNLKSVILYGSAAAGNYVPEHSDVNLMCVLGDTSFAAIATLTPAVIWWGKQKHHAPLLMTMEEIRRGADVFSIEYLDMKQHYRVLWGDDALKGLEIPTTFH